MITQSFSKSRSLAGIRLGCAFANEDLIEALNRVKNSFNSYPIDRLAQVAGVKAIQDEDYFNLTRVKIIEARKFLEKELLLLILKFSLQEQILYLLGINQKMQLLSLKN